MPIEAVCSLCFGVVEEVMMSKSASVEQLNKDYIITAEAAIDERVGEVVNRHRRLIKPSKQFVHVNFLLCYFLFSSVRLAEYPNSKFTIVVVRNCEQVTPRVLLHLFQFYVTAFLASNLFLEHTLVTF